MSELADASFECLRYLRCLNLSDTDINLRARSVVEAFSITGDSPSGEAGSVDNMGTDSRVPLSP